MRNRKTMFGGVLVALAMVLGACGNGAESSGREPGAGGGPRDQEASGEVDLDASVRLAQYAVGRSFDPYKGRSPLSDATWYAAVYDQLVVPQMNEDRGLDILPGLAESWEFSPDGTSLTLNLRDDVTFRDGTKFDASVVKANFERGIDAESPNARALGSVTSIEAVDPTTVKIDFDGPTFDFVYTLAVDAYIGYMVSPDWFDNPELENNPNEAGSGPYILVDQAQDRATFERAENYWNPDFQRVKEVEFIAVGDNNARFSGFRSGQYDAVSVQPSDFHDIEDLLDENGLVNTGNQVMGLLLNTSEPSLSDPRVRRALNLAVDRDAISQALFFDQAEAVYQPILPQFPGHMPELDEGGYDPEEAKRLLAEAGQEDLTFSCILSSTEPYDSVGMVVQQELAKIGVTMNLEPYAPTEARPSFQQGVKPCYNTILVAGADSAGIILSSYVGPNNPGGNAPELDELIETALATEFGSSERQTAFEAVNRYLVENPVHAMNVNFPLQVLHKPEIIGVDRQGIALMSSQFDVRSLAVAAG